MDEEHESGTAFFRDIYSIPYIPIKQGYARYQKTDWRDMYRCDGV